MPPEATITACALKLEIAGDVARALVAALDGARLQDVAAHAVDGRTRAGQFVDPVTEFEADQPAFLGLAHALHERFEHAGAGAPGDVEARHRIAVADGIAAAALGPADDGKEFQAALHQPGAFLAGGKADIGLGPFARPEILRPIESGGAQPVLERQIMRIADAHAPLLGRIDEEKTAERPERLAAERLLRLLVDDDDLLAGLGQLGGGNQPGKAGADNDHVRIVSHFSPHR